MAVKNRCFMVIKIKYKKNKLIFENVLTRIKFADIIVKLSDNSFVLLLRRNLAE